MESNLPTCPGLVALPLHLTQRTTSPTKGMLHQQVLKLGKLSARLQQGIAWNESILKSAGLKELSYISQPSQVSPKGTLVLRPREALIGGGGQGEQTAPTFLEAVRAGQAVL